ncbi:hypothetical protein O3S68_16580 [Kosakonia sp. SOY2]|uniref:gp53-like domain-containing protein n=1 Tax=Kosakonia sp. SOY2 TaxID=3014557 RepID=UPI0022AC3080|nr:hypothetical protein [Kosakonia sp. SOY2]MCZ3383898.1 hypothetical protein [Kosakonia sp. SOY2]
MHRIDTPAAQVDKFGPGKNGFTRGNPQTGTPATELDDDYFDMLQEELAAVVEASGAVLNKTKHDQLLTALKSLLLSRANPFADIKADGATAVAQALTNLGLKTAALKDVGTGIGQIPDMSSFTSSIGSTQSSSGWFKLPTPDGKGLLIQWMLCVTAAAGHATYNFPTPFPNNVFAMAMVPGGSGSSVVNAGGLTNSGAEFITNGAFTFSVIVVGR